MSHSSVEAYVVPSFYYSAGTKTPTEYERSAVVWMHSERPLEALLSLAVDQRQQTLLFLEPGGFTNKAKKIFGLFHMVRI